MTTRSTLVDQTIVIAGAAAGVLGEWLCRPQAHRHFFAAGAAGGWVAVGAVALLTGELALRGRFGPAKHYYGIAARLLGVLMSVMAAMIYFAISNAK